MTIQKAFRVGVLGALAATTLGVSNAHAAEITWQQSINTAMAQAKKSKKPLLLNFSTTWCGPCQDMKRTTFKDAKVVAESKKWVMVHIDGDRQANVAAKYKVEGYPTMIILKPNGAVVSRATSGMSATQFLNWVKSKYGAAKK